MSVDFFLTSMVVILLPGTGVIYTLAVGLGKGFKLSIVAAFGCTLGILPAAISSIVGLAAILHANAEAFQIVKLMGVLYLFYMAWKVLRDGGALDVSEERPESNVINIIKNGMLLNVLNPKLSLFFLAFLPQFVSVKESNPTATLVLLALVFMLLTFVVFVGYGMCASLAREYVISRPVVMLWMKRSFAGIFGLLGVKLALSD